MMAFGTSTDNNRSQAMLSQLVSSPVRVSVVSSMQSSRLLVSQDLTRMALLLGVRLACVKAINDRLSNSLEKRRMAFDCTRRLDERSVQF
jgi:hypothetical protein